MGCGISVVAILISLFMVWRGSWSDVVIAFLLMYAGIINQAATSRLLLAQHRRKTYSVAETIKPLSFYRLRAKVIILYISLFAFFIIGMTTRDILNVSEFSVKVIATVVFGGLFINELFELAIDLLGIESVVLDRAASYFSALDNYSEKLPDERSAGCYLGIVQRRGVSSFIDLGVQEESDDGL